MEFEQGQRRVPCVTCSGSGVDWRKSYDAQRLRADTAEGALKIAAEDAALLLKDLDAAEQRNSELRELLRLMPNDYACCLEAGHDRITFLGGDCDSVSKMLADNSNYAKACAALSTASPATIIQQGEGV